MVSCISRTRDFWPKTSAKGAAYTRVFMVYCENIINHAFYLMKFKELKENTLLTILLQKTPKCVLKLYFEARKVLLVCVFLISRTRLPLLNIPSIINFTQFFSFDPLLKILKMAQKIFLSVNHVCTIDNANNFILKFCWH